MLKHLVIGTYVVWILSVLAHGISLYSILLLIPCSMFAVRLMDVVIKPGGIIGVEAFFLFCSVMYTLLLSEIVLWRLIILIILRVISVGIAIYDSTQYVYTSVEVKKN